MSSSDEMSIDPTQDDDGIIIDKQQTKIRVSFLLSPSVRHNRHQLELPSEPMAVPSNIRKRGLSAIVNHLLDRGDKDDDNDDDSASDDDEDNERLPSIPFDFLLNDKLLRLPLDSAARNLGLSTEHALELHYFPARLPPKKEGQSEQLPDWIMVMEYNNGRLWSGGADGVIRTFEQEGEELKSGCVISAHTGPIKCVSSLTDATSDLTYVATGSMDQTLVTHAYNSKKGELSLHAVYSGGHGNSISSVALAAGGSGGGDGKQIMASGDWDGGLAIWNVPGSSSSNDNVGGDANGKKSSKKRKDNNSNSTSSSIEGTIQEVQPIQSVRAHSSNISGLAWGYNSSSSSSLPSTLLTGSWDHGLKVYDVSRMDCILALNGSRVVTSLSRCSNSDVVATGSPDCTVRLWDMRTNGEGGSGSQIADKTLRQSHKSWVSAIQWSPTDPFVLATTSHDGTLKVWDIRSSLPLHTVKATANKGDKSLCLAFGDGFIYSGGSDCVVKKFAL
eukprot:CAMPEP_0113415006 /NCGR_PEP_ID=MMETSP0013_2-20120614/24330_1 /TAXON_ID=2843 ORGANISM="Skeletonema costatum, Strain 1716" /NCGR_SAMPLE_ID=MMETSP0013_2 /ASSEMBLY_ACC=CAM_ASM_000158 /LENGTH=501 /DNA_ID=CAMNT_0000301921 /DNA_START=125 /DNA_END=1630 /DNA_ORIENTATION=+ /assembly_acc=CAM_ASM_000158